MHKYRLDFKHSGTISHRFLLEQRTSVCVQVETAGTRTMFAFDLTVLALDFTGTLTNTRIVANVTRAPVNVLTLMRSVTALSWSWSLFHVTDADSWGAAMGSACAELLLAIVVFFLRCQVDACLWYALLDTPRGCVPEASLEDGSTPTNHSTRCTPPSRI